MKTLEEDKVNFFLFIYNYHTDTYTHILMQKANRMIIMTDRPSNMYSINGPISQREEDDLDQEFAVMKGLKRQTAAA